MVVLGYPDTTHVTMDHMVHHVGAVARGAGGKLVVADLPYGSIETPTAAVLNARRLISAGASAVKAEGGVDIVEAVSAVAEAGIPLIGHLGMLPQRVKSEGGYRIKGKTDIERQQLLSDAHTLEDAGAKGFVLEMVRPDVAEAITTDVSVPTIGIGSGQDCDGQILVTHDLVGMFPWFTPRFVSPKESLGERLKKAVNQWCLELADHE